MNKQSTKTGRARRYGLEPLPGFKSRDIALSAAFLGEAKERVADQVGDLPPDALGFAPADTGLSIAKLVVHLAWGESQWVRRITGEETPSELKNYLEEGKLETLGEPLRRTRSASELITLCRRVHSEITIPSLSPLENIRAEIKIRNDRLPRDVSGVLMHLLWHWTYHSGHIGLIRLQWGSDYVWTMEEDTQAS